MKYQMQSDLFIITYALVLQGISVESDHQEDFDWWLAYINGLVKEYIRAYKEPPPEDLMQYILDKAYQVRLGNRAEGSIYEYCREFEEIKTKEKLARWPTLTNWKR